MRFDKYKAFPYPVLRPQSDDYLDCDFQVIPEFSIEKEKIKATITFVISSEEIVEQITNGNAEYIVTISCRDTYFQSVLASTNDKIEAEFNISDFRGEVKISPYVVAKKDITSFVSPDINSEFGSGPFRFIIGDVLAQDDTYVFYLERDMFKPITSVFKLVSKDGQTEGIWTATFDGDYVQIEVSPSMKEIIDNARSSKPYRAILINSIYFAAVMQAIQKLKDPETAPIYDDTKWAKIIRGQAQNKNCNFDSHDAYLIAERLMQQPITLLSTHVFKRDE